MLSASWTRVTTCADDVVRPRRSALPRFEGPSTAASWIVRRKRSGASGWESRYADQRAWMAGCMCCRGKPARATSRAGITGLEDWDRLHPAAQVLAEYRADVEPRGSAAGELPVDEKDACSPARARRCEREAIVPPKITVHERFLGAFVPKLFQAGAHAGARLHAGYEIQGTGAEVEQQLVRWLRERQPPHRVGAGRGRSSIQSAGSLVQGRE